MNPASEEIGGSIWATKCLKREKFRVLTQVQVAKISMKYEELSFDYVKKKFEPPRRHFTKKCRNAAYEIRGVTYRWRAQMF